MRSGVLLLLTLTLTLAVHLPARQTYANGYQQAEGVKRGEKKADDLLSVISMPMYKQLSNPYPADKKPLLPNGWFLEVKVFGGLTGTTKEYILLTSDGDITVDTLEVYRNLRLPEGIVEIDRLIKLARPSRWGTTEANTPA